MSTKLTPAAVTRIWISPGPGLGTGASVIRPRSCGPLRDVCRRARMVAGMLMGILCLSNDQQIVAWSSGLGQGNLDRTTNNSGGVLDGYSRPAAHVRPGRRAAGGAG